MTVAIIAPACGSKKDRSKKEPTPSASGKPSGDRYGGYLRLHSNEPQYLNPVLQTRFERVTPLVFEGLVGLDARMEPVKRLAEDWQISESGNYFHLVSNFFGWVFVDYIASGMILGWLAYALGRFLIGAWVGRHGWVARAPDFLRGWRRLARVALPAGLVLEGFATMLAHATWLPEWEHREFLADALHLLAVPVLAAGYVAGIVVAFQGGPGRRLLTPFAAVGRMALTNYLAQSLVIGFVLFGIGPGLALAGKIGAGALSAIVVVVFIAQMACSHWWLQRFAYGPAEWAWRALTYGEPPAMRKGRALAPPLK